MKMDYYVVLLYVSFNVMQQIHTRKYVQITSELHLK